MNYFNKKLAITLACMTVIGSLPIQAQANSDIKGHWAEISISKMKEQGFISGYSDGSFHPNKEMSRAEFVVALNKIMCLSGEAILDFSDVKENDWFAKDVAIALHHGYIKGYKDGTFRPNQLVSRLEAAVMISKANKLNEKVKASDDDLDIFEDKESIPAWAKLEFAAIVKSGIMKGNLNKLFQGKNNITRAEAVVSLSKLKEVKESFTMFEKNQLDFEKEIAE